MATTKPSTLQLNQDIFDQVKDLISEVTANYEPQDIAAHFHLMEDLQLDEGTSLKSLVRRINQHFGLMLDAEELMEELEESHSDNDKGATVAKLVQKIDEELEWG